MRIESIKFRGKSKKTGEWLYGDLVRNIEGAFAIVPPFEMTTNNYCDQYEVDENTIGQLVFRFEQTDGTFQEIYTDDVLDIWDTEDREIPHSINIVDKYSIVTFRQDYWFTVESLTKYKYDFNLLGNIYDNPDLKDKAI